MTRAPRRDGGFGEGVSHASAGAVGEVADGIDFFAGGAGGDENRFAGKVLRRAEGFESGGNDGSVFGEASGAGHAAGEISAAGFDDLDSALAQSFQILLRGGMVPHVYVHGRGDDDRRCGREKESGQEIVGDSLGKFSRGRLR